MGKSMTLQDVTWSYRRGELMLQTLEYSSLLVLSIPLTLFDTIRLMNCRAQCVLSEMMF